MATGDSAMMADFGAEIMVESSRFWMSRLEPMSGGEFGLTRVVAGPDEFHEHVDNNAYTNYLVGCASCRPRRPARTWLAPIRPSTRRWCSGSGSPERRYLPPTSADGVIEFDGYFTLTELPVTLDENQMPRYPDGYHHYNLEKSKLLKQADVVMLTYVLPDEFSDEVKRAQLRSTSPGRCTSRAAQPGRSLDHGHRGRRPEPGGAVLPAGVFVDLIDNRWNRPSAGGTWRRMVPAGSAASGCGTAGPRSSRGCAPE